MRLSGMPLPVGHQSGQDSARAPPAWRNSAPLLLAPGPRIVVRGDWQRRPRRVARGRVVVRLAADVAYERELAAAQREVGLAIVALVVVLARLRQAQRRAKYAARVGSPA